MAEIIKVKIMNLGAGHGFMEDGAYKLIWLPVAIQENILGVSILDDYSETTIRLEVRNNR